MLSRAIAIAVYLLISLSVTSASAQETQIEGKRPVHLILGVAGMFGGDELVDYHYTISTPGLPGSSDGSSSVRAGAGAHLFLGGSLQFDPVPLEIQLNLGWKVNRSKTIEDKDTPFKRYTTEGFLFYHLSGWRIGGGLVYHLNPTLEENIVYNKDFRFENAFGHCFDIGLNLSSKTPVFISVRYTAIEYVFDNNPDKASGNSVGLVVTVSI